MEKQLEKIPAKQKPRKVYGVRDPKKLRTVNFDSRESAWDYARHVGADTVFVFEVQGNLIRRRQDDTLFKK